MRQIDINKKYIKRGFNLVEAAIVLGVIGLVIGGIWVTASTVSENMRINQATTGMMQLITRARERYRDVDLSAPAIDGTYIAVDSGLFENLDGYTYINQWAVKDPWGNLINNTMGVDPGGTQMFAVDFFNLPKAACMRMIASFASPQKGVIYLHTQGGTDLLAEDMPYMPQASDCPLSANGLVLRFGK